jgi:UDP-N-acetylglucosamine:LPS N-acetylglucosamine transferase
MSGNPRLKIALVCSSGGHLFELLSLRPFWQEHDRFWVTFPGADTRFHLSDERVMWAFYPTNRNLKNFVRNFFLALRLLGREKPDLVLSTGAGVSVPFIYAGRLKGIPCLYLESLARVRTLSLSARLVYPFANALLVQWPELAEKYRKAQYRGQVI